MRRWTLIAVAIALVLFAVALSNAVYEATSPTALSWHVLLRKFYSIIAFSLVGYTARRAFDEWGVNRSPLVATVAVAVYSGLIEIGQFLMGSQEGLFWNAVDVACGAIGGFVGNAVVRKTV